MSSCVSKYCQPISFAKKDLIQGLDEILFLLKKGKFVIHKEQEDGHTAIEEYLTKKLGAKGKKNHTGRSRNDQILVTLRLYTLNMLSIIQGLVKDAMQIIHKQSQKWIHQKMPGYTHTQKAMPTTVGIWLSSFSDALADDLVLLTAVQKIIDQNPLGSGAGFGTSVIPVDRAYTTRQLGFAKTQNNPIYCAHSRGKFENMVLQVFNNIMLDIGKCANDLVWFTSKEFDFFDFPETYKTGSSMMPNKHNFDVLELLRGNVSIFLGYQYQIQEVIKNLFSGYNRDLQLTKEPYIKALTLFIETVQVFILCMKHLEIHPDKLNKACTDELYATEKTLKLVQTGVPFRQAYKYVKKHL